MLALTEGSSARRYSLKAWVLAILGSVTATAAAASTEELETIKLIESPRFNLQVAVDEARARIEAGKYEYYTVDLCVDDRSRCQGERFESFKKAGSTTGYELTIKRNEWLKLHTEVQDAVLREIVYYTWGAPQRKDSPLLATLVGHAGTSPLEQLSPIAAAGIGRFSTRNEQEGGLGRNAYVPNCWYTAVSAIAEGTSAYASKMGLVAASWTKPRFMGPEEFRAHLQQFERTEEPMLGDIVRYYIDDAVYLPDADVFAGEIHGAVVVGQERTVDAAGKPHTRVVVLTKNGRRDLDFPILQSLEELDKVYLNPSKAHDLLVEKYHGQNPRKRAFYRVKRGAALLDPGSAGERSLAYLAYMTDRFNFREKWVCLADASRSGQDGASCAGLPQKFTTLSIVGRR
jgi:hypothetical protein